MVCDPNPGARERAIVALGKAYPGAFSHEQAGMIVDIVSEALIAGTLQAQIQH